ncbi:MAG: class I SAM-dependent methyltransferase [Roseovarius sp.]|nr:class I SAM-dependent methyltransferase [Roseovarius sp.]
MPELTDIDEINAYLKRPLPKLRWQFPNGWMSASDLHFLYNIAHDTKGDVLEIGPWLGRSSTAISSGLRDREAEGGAPVKYDIIDYGIASADEWQERFDQPLKLSHDKGRVAEAVLHPGGSNAVLINNLKQNDLLRYTNTIMRGDIVDSPIQRSYSMIFCDALHDMAEVERNMPRIAGLTAPGGVLVADDVIADDMAQRIAEFLDVKRYFFTKTVREKRAKLCIFELGDRGTAKTTTKTRRKSK